MSRKTKPAPANGIAGKLRQVAGKARPDVSLFNAACDDGICIATPPAPDKAAADVATTLKTADEIVTAMVAGYKPTAEQAAILEAATAAGLEVLVIAAGAGAGKTSTLRMLEETLVGRGQYTAFNSSLVTESKSKFRRAQCNTTHSLAFRTVGRQFAHRLNGNRMQSYQIAQRLGIEATSVVVGQKEDGTPHNKQLNAGFLAGQVLVAIRKFCQSADRELTVDHFRYIPGIDETDPETGKRGYVNNNAIRERLLPFAIKAWTDLSSPEGTLPFNHDIYVKVWQLGTGKNRPIIDADYILIDESQDLSPVVLNVLEQQNHALLVLVGDSNQQIYEWRGAVNAMKAFPGAPRRLLSQSFRFGQTVADVANSILSGLEEPTDLVMSGLESIPSRVDYVAKPDCVLCRSNACAVSTVIQAIADGRRPHLIGGGDEVVKFVKAARDLQVPRPTSHPELCCFETWAEVQAYAKTDEGEEIRLLCRLVDQFGADVIIAALENMPAEKDADLVVSTAHKSKGREWDTVKLADDFPPAARMSDADCRLLYVAATRARHVLDVTDCTPFHEYKDKVTGDVTPGIRIQYTVPMPTEADLDVYLAEKAAKKAEKPVSAAVQPAPVALPAINGNAAPASANGNGGSFTWAKLESGDWGFRGPKGRSGQTVTVARKDGSTSQVTLGAIDREFTEVCLYKKT